MEVFLQNNTELFIKSLFEAIESEEYLEGPPKELPKPVEAETADGDEEKKEEGNEKQAADSTTPIRNQDAEVGGGADRGMGKGDRYRGRDDHRRRRSRSR